MDGFGDNFVPNGDSTAVDPAAEFLAREQDELAGLEDAPVIAADDNSASLTFEDLAATDIPNTSGTSFDEVLTEPDAPASLVEDVAAADDAVVADLDSAGETLPGGGAPLVDQMSAAAAQRTPERVVTPVPRIDPEAIRVWREEHQRKLVEKDAAEEEAKDALREKAKQELVDWYKQHDEQVAKTRQANRCAEKELVADTERPEPGTEWERIAKLCDFNPKTARSSRDVSRMRSIILHVKQSPPIKA